MSEELQNEIVATGDLYFQIGAKSWTLRKFLISGANMVYFDNMGTKRGQMELINCTVKKMTPQEVKYSQAKYPFGISGQKGAQWLLCAVSELDRDTWVDILNVQIEEFKDENRRFLNSNEVIKGVGTLKKVGLFGLTKYRLLLTNYPRLIFVDPDTQQVKEEIRWTANTLPVYKKVDGKHFTICHNGLKEVKMKTEKKEVEAGRGIDYWEKLLNNLDRMKLYNPSRSRTPAVIGVTGTLMEDLDRVNWDELRRRKAITAIPPERLSSAGRFGANVIYDTPDMDGRMTEAGPEMGAQARQLLEGGEEEMRQRVDELVSGFRDTVSELRTVMTHVVRQITEVDAAPEQKQQAARSLVMTVQALCSNLTALTNQGEANGYDPDLVENIGDMCQDTSDLLRSLVSEHFAADLKRDLALRPLSAAKDRNGLSTSNSSAVNKLKLNVTAALDDGSEGGNGSKDKDKEKRKSVTEVVASSASPRTRLVSTRWTPNKQAGSASADPFADFAASMVPDSELHVAVGARRGDASPAKTPAEAAAERELMDSVYNSALNGENIAQPSAALSSSRRAEHQPAQEYEQDAPLLRSRQNGHSTTGGDDYKYVSMRLGEEDPRFNPRNVILAQQAMQVIKLKSAAEATHSESDNISVLTDGADDDHTQASASSGGPIAKRQPPPPGPPASIGRGPAQPSIDLPYSNSPHSNSNNNSSRTNSVAARYNPTASGRFQVPTGVAPNNFVAPAGAGFNGYSSNGSNSNSHGYEGRAASPRHSTARDQQEPAVAVRSLGPSSYQPAPALSPPVTSYSASGNYVAASRAAQMGGVGVMPGATGGGSRNYNAAPASTSAPAPTPSAGRPYGGASAAGTYGSTYSQQSQNTHQTQHTAQSQYTSQSQSPRAVDSEAKRALSTAGKAEYLSFAQSYATAPPVTSFKKPVPATPPPIYGAPKPAPSKPPGYAAPRPGAPPAPAPPRGPGAPSYQQYRNVNI